MRVIICGSRDITDYDLVAQAISDSGFTVTEVVTGGASGVDRLGKRWARYNGIPEGEFPAQWETYGKAAGPIRNSEMADYASQDPEGGALIAIRKNMSRGTTDMINKAKAKGLQIYIKEVNGE